MTVTIEGKELVIRIALETPKPSKSGKTLVVASTYGNKPTAAIIARGADAAVEHRVLRALKALEARAAAMARQQIEQAAFKANQSSSD